MTVRILLGDVREKLAELADESVHMVCTSPPYWNLRDYGVAGQIGLEETPEAYVAVLVEVFREVRRVMRPDATLFLNLGDSYQDKQLLGIPWRVAFALQADGWYLRQDIIWCLSGGTRVYTRTQKGEMPMSIKDMVRLDPATVQLWNGEKWTQALGWSKTPRPDKTYEIELRNGQRIGCTAGHLWPTQRGNVRADQLAVGDVIATCRLPEPSTPKQPAALDDEMIGWFVGLYIAEGSRFDGTIQIASHTKEEERFGRLKRIAEAFHGTAAVHKTSDFGCTVAVNGPVLNGIIDAYVSGRVASDKHLHPRCWQRSDVFLRAVLEGYLSGDGHWDTPNERWRLGFCTNDELVADLRTIGARLGISVRLRRSNHTLNGDSFPGYRGELRYKRSNHHNSRDDGEVVAIRESRARKFWDIGVADEPHTFALASGVLTHNSKPNPMPESVTDRCTKAHEYLFLLTRSPRYHYDAEAIAEPFTALPKTPGGFKPEKAVGPQDRNGHSQWDRHRTAAESQPNEQRNRRSVWTVATQPFKEAHFATFPPDLIEPCILAGCPKDCCAKCGAPVVRQTMPSERYAKHLGRGFNDHSGDQTAGMMQNRGVNRQNLMMKDGITCKETVTTGWSPSCACNAGTVPGTCLDPFGGAGTTGLVADRLQRSAILIELNPAYLELAASRIEDDAPLFAVLERDHGKGP